jgi:hypothetical protein
MIIRNEDDPGGSCTATEASDFDGWEIIHVGNWKPGVKRVYMRKIDPSGSGSFQMVFADESIVPEVTNGAD